MIAMETEKQQHTQSKVHQYKQKNNSILSLKCININRKTTAYSD